MKILNQNNKSERGNAVVIVLIVLAVVAVGALAYLSGQIAPMDDEQTTPAVIEAEAQAATELADANAEVNAETTGEITSDEVAVDPAAGDPVSETQEAAAEEGVSADQPKIEPGNPVVAKIGDEDVTRLDVLNFITQLPPNIRQLPIEQLFPLAQEQVINSKVVEMNIDEASVESDPEVQKQIATAKDQIVRNAYLQKQVDGKLTDGALKKAYADFIKEQPDVEEVKAAHILVEDEAVAKDIIAKLKDGGDFAALAKEFSKDNTAENGGDLGYFAKGDVVPEFAEAAFSTKPGKYSQEPVKTDFGFHVLSVAEKRMRPKPSFEEAKSMIENDLGRKLLDETLKGWREKEKIVKFDINGNAIEAAADAEVQ